MTPPPPLPSLPQAEASEQLGVMLPREKHKQAYNKALVQRFKHMPEIKRIVRHRHLPAAIYKVRGGLGGALLHCAAQAPACGHLYGAAIRKAGCRQTPTTSCHTPGSPSRAPHACAPAPGPPLYRPPLHVCMQPRSFSVRSPTRHSVCVHACMQAQKIRRVVTQHCVCACMHACRPRRYGVQ